ncbi:MAG: hypothetical protein WBV92_01970 [Nitrosotalea sp.]
MNQIEMIGKIIVIAILGLAFIAYTGVNASQYYQDFIMIRDKAQPMADNLIEKVLGDASHYDLKSKIDQLTGGKIG